MGRSGTEKNGKTDKNGSEKIAVVTGANRGLGLATSWELARAGYHVVLGARKLEQVKTEAQKMIREKLQATAYPLDTSNEGSIREFTQTVLKEFGHVDVLVNNAGVFLDSKDGGDKTSLTVKATTLDQTFATNTRGPFLLIQQFLPSMTKNNFGRIVNVSSGMGQLSEMNGAYPAYRLSKTALNAVTRLFADEVKNKNVLINSVCPGWVRTDMGGPSAARTVAEGIYGIVWAATLPDGGPTGGFFRDGKKLDW